MGPFPPRFQQLCLREDPSGLWIAEADGSIVGFAMSWMRERFWFLAQLFVRPHLQTQGIGQALLSKTLEQARRNGAENRALVTFAYNTRSTGLYIRNGMFPREPLYAMAAPSGDLAARLGHTGGYDVQPLILSAQDWMGAIDEEVLGFRRDVHHHMLQQEGGTAVQIERAGSPVGYAYISAEGHIGPLALDPGVDTGSVLIAVLRRALQARPNSVSLIVPGSAENILKTASEVGLRLAEPYVILSERPFGRWATYLPRDPGYL
jgi:GNAT superfamily N-acetyltransferase